jgi:hypothetical protein
VKDNKLFGFTPFSGTYVGNLIFLNQKNCEKTGSGSAGDMSQYFPATPLAVMQRDIGLFNPGQQAIIR